MSITEFSPTISRNDELLPEAMVNKLFEQLTQDPSKTSQKALIDELIRTDENIKWAYLNLRPVIQRYLRGSKNNTSDQNQFVEMLLAQSTVALDKNNYTEYFTDAFEASQLIAAFEAVSYPELYVPESDTLSMLMEVPAPPPRRNIN